MRIRKFLSRVIDAVRDVRDTIGSFRRMSDYEHDTYQHDTESLHEALVDAYETIEMLRTQLIEQEAETEMAHEACRDAQERATRAEQLARVSTRTTKYKN